MVGTDVLTASRIRLTDTTNATVSATNHVQIGSSSGNNLRLDNNQIVHIVVVVVKHFT